MRTSEQINEIAGALAKAQGEIKSASKDGTNPHFNSKYATLDSLWEAVRGPLSAAGVSLIQGTSSQPDGDGVAVTVVTRLMHSSGQWLESELTMWPKDASPQAIGSVLTYGRRYGLAGMVGVTAEEDDDGNAGQQAGRKPVPGYYQRPAPKSNVPMEQVGQPDRKPAQPPTTAKEAEEAFPLLPPAAGAAKPPAIESGVMTAENRKERESLLATADELAGELDLTTDQRSTIWGTYCGTATRKNVAVAALRELVGYLNLRLDQRRSA